MKFVDGWAMLLLQRGVNRKAHRWLRNRFDLERSLRDRRKQYLGSGISLSALVRARDGSPDYQAIEGMTNYLARQAATQAMRSDCDAESDFEIYASFFYFGLFAYAWNKIDEECVDDLIRLGECYAADLTTYEYVMENYLPADELEDLRVGLRENDVVPWDFARHVQAAVAIFLGVLPEVA